MTSDSHLTRGSVPMQSAVVCFAFPKHLYTSAPRLKRMNANPLSLAGRALSRLESKISEEWLSSWTPAEIPDMRGMTAMVTGANSGMGYEVSRKLAENGAKVFMVCRDMTKGQEAAARIRQAAGKSVQLQVLQCDMRSLRNVADTVKEFKRESKALHVLVNMAGVFYAHGRGNKTADGIEQTLGINYYAQAMLTLGLLDTLRSTYGSRVVFMASGIAPIGRIDWNNLKGENFTDSGLRPYATSKLYTIMFAKELAERVPDLDVFAVHPGLVATPLHKKSDPGYILNDLFKLVTPVLGQTPLRGAYSTLYAATEPSLQGKHFGFYAPQLALLNLFPTTERPWWVSGRASNKDNTRRLFDATQDILHDLLAGDAPPRVPASHPIKMTQ